MVFYFKLDASGNFSWVNTYGAPNGYFSMLALSINNNNPIVAGSFSGTVDFDLSGNTQILSALNDGFVLQLDANGNFTFVRQYDASTGYSVVNAIAQDNLGNIYATGSFSNAIDLDPGSAISLETSSANSQKLFVSKLSPSGNFIYGKSLADNGEANITGFQVDASNNVLLSGSYFLSCDMDPSAGVYMLTQPVYSDGFIVKLNSSGDFSWAKQYVGDDEVIMNGLAVDNVGNAYLTGYYVGSIDMDPGAGTTNFTSMNAYNIIMSKLNANGDYAYGYEIGGLSDDAGFLINVANNNIYSVGAFSMAVDFDPSSGTSNLTSLNFDTYCFKWSQCTPSITNVNATGCSYTLNGQTYNSNGTYSQYFTNSTGCDSIIYLTLSGSGSNTSISPIVCGSSYSYNGQTYTASGTYVQNYTNVAGCDSNTTINLSLGASTSSTLNEVACDFYFFDNSYLNTSGTYYDTITNASGCDSLITLNLIINSGNNMYLPVTACDSYTFEGTTYTNSGYYTFYFVNASGCDSIVNLDLTITSIPPTTLTQTACNSYTWYGQVYSNSGAYNHLLSSVDGCDSMLNLNLTITTPNISVTQSNATLSAAASGASYQWLKCNPYSIIAGATNQSYTAIANGSYAVAVTQNGCTDTSACKIVSGLSINNSELSSNIKIYPNPVGNTLTVEMAQSQLLIHTKIITLTGQLIYEANFANTNQIMIPVHDIAKGMYFIEISLGDNKHILKFIKD